MNNILLEKITNPSDLKNFSIDQLEKLASEIRSHLIDTISKTGGHIGANLGVIELTIALHKVFDGINEPLLFDVGHQGYTHKILTGRLKLFETLNKFGGMSRFLSKSESQYDFLDASHGGTSISTATGMAYANKISGSKELVVAIIGDGSIVEGMAFEGINYAAQEGLPLIIVINDNGMAIAPNVGGIKNLFSGKNWISKSREWFENMGYAYEAVKDGHNISEICTTLRKARKKVKKKPVIVHVKTKKGCGLDLADKHPYKLHFSMPFDPTSGEGISATPIGESYQSIVGDALTEFMKKSNNVYAITPATPYASGIEDLMKKFPDRAIDVGMAEQHAVGMAAGLALNGKIVFSCFQSTFMQRAIDQIFHDICFPEIPITIISSRSGFSGYDGPTHHGIYDFSFLRTLPNIKVFYAGTKRDLVAILKERYEYRSGPMIILHPYELISQANEKFLPKKETPLEHIECIDEGKDGVIIAVGNKLSDAIELKKLLYQNKNQNFSIYNLRWINPLPFKDLELLLKKNDKAIIMEESIRNGGIGCSIGDFIISKKIRCKLFISAIDNIFLPAGDKKELSLLSKIDAKSIFNQLMISWD